MPIGTKPVAEKETIQNLDDDSDGDGEKEEGDDDGGSCAHTMC